MTHRLTLNFDTRLFGVTPGTIVEMAQASQERDGDSIPLLRESLERLAETIRERTERQNAEISRTAVELGVALAERLLLAEIAADRQRIDRIVEASLQRMPPSSAVTVRCHPRDLELLERPRENEGADRPALKLRPDPSVERGRLKLESDEWFVEWDTNRALAELRYVLLEEIVTEGNS